ncbi:MAG: hypothetical protein ACOYJB_07125 [Christensenellaceae bacterium]
MSRQALKPFVYGLSCFVVIILYGHSCASILLNMGYSLAEVSEWMGHSSIRVTKDIYGHLEFQTKQNIAQGLSSKFKALRSGNAADINADTGQANPKVQFSNVVAFTCRKDRNSKQEAYD